MKKILPLLLCLLVMLQVPVSAEVKKSISEYIIHLANESRYEVANTDKSFWLSFNKEGFSPNSFKNKNLQITQQILIGLYKNEAIKLPKTDIIFSSKTPPYFTLLSNGQTIKQPFRITELGTDIVIFSIDDKAGTLLSNATKAAFVVTLQDGTTQAIDIPDNVLKEWKYIIDCDLWQEYKKGV